MPAYKALECVAANNNTLWVMQFDDWGRIHVYTLMYLCDQESPSCAYRWVFMHALTIFRSNVSETNWPTCCIIM